MTPQVVTEATSALVETLMEHKHQFQNHLPGIKRCSQSLVADQVVQIVTHFESPLRRPTHLFLLTAPTYGKGKQSHSRMTWREMTQVNVHLRDRASHILLVHSLIRQEQWKQQCLETLHLSWIVTVVPQKYPSISFLFPSIPNSSKWSENSASMRFF